MPVFEFQAPDGSILEIEGPTQPPMEVVERLYNERKQTAAAPAPMPTPQQRGPSPLEKLPQGAVITPDRPGYYEHEYVPGEPPITGAEGFRRAAMTTATGTTGPTPMLEREIGGAWEAAAGRSVIDVAEDTIQRELAKQTVQEQQGENILESAGRDVAEIVKGIGSIVGLSEGAPSPQAESYSQAEPMLMQKGPQGFGPVQDPLLTSAVGGIGGWYGAIMADPAGTLRYNPAEGALEIIGPLTEGVRWLKSVGKADEATKLETAIKSATMVHKSRAAKAGERIDHPRVNPQTEIVDITVGDANDTMTRLKIEGGEASPSHIENLAAEELGDIALGRFATQHAEDGFTSEMLIEAGLSPHTTPTRTHNWIKSTDKFEKGLDGRWRPREGMDFGGPAAVDISDDAVADLLGKLTGKPLRSLSHEDIDAIYRGDKPELAITKDTQNLILESRNKGFSTREGAAASSKKILDEGRAGSDLEVVGMGVRLKVIEPELMRLTDDIPKMDTVPDQMKATFLELGEEYVDLVMGLRRAGSYAGYRLNLQKMALAEYSSLRNMVARATVKKGGKLTQEQLEYLTERSKVAKESLDGMDEIKIGIADRLGVSVKSLEIDSTGIPVHATGTEVDKLQRLFGELIKQNSRTARYIDRLDPNRLGGPMGWLEDHYMSVITLPKMIMAGMDLSFPLRQGIFFHLTAPFILGPGWKAMFASAKPSFVGGGLVKHPWNPEKLITSREFARLSQREALTGIRPGMSAERIGVENEITKTIKSMGVDLTGIGDDADPLFNYQGGRQKGYSGALKQSEENLMGAMFDPWEEIILHETAGKTPSLAKSLATRGIQGLARNLKRYGNFSERTFALGLNHMRRAGVKTILGLDGMSAKEIAAFRKAHMARDPEGLKRVGKFINAAFGRGDLAGLEKASFWSGLAQTLMFSPRFVMSRFMIAGMPAKSVFNKLAQIRRIGVEDVDLLALPKLSVEAMARALPKRGKIGGMDIEKAVSSKFRDADYLADADDMIIKEAMAAATRIAGMVTIANMAGEAFFGRDIIDDSVKAGSDWMKVRVPGTNTRLDVFGGMMGPLRFLYTMGSGNSYSLSGKEKRLDVDFGSTRANEMWRYARGKASPIASVVLDQWTGRDYKGDPADLYTAAKDSMMPIIVQDMIESGLLPVGSEGLSPESLLVLPALFGVGYTNFPMRGGYPTK